jgi:S1-C subfamily serine protease
VTRMVLGALCCFLVAACSSLPPSREAGSPPPRGPGSAVTVAATSEQRAAREQTWRVQVLLCSGIGVGSAVALDRHTLVTNAHVVEGYRSIAVSSWDGSPATVLTVATADGADLAVIRVAEPLPHTARTGPLPVPGDEIIASGYPGGGKLSVSTGPLVGLVPGSVLDVDADVLRFTGEVSKGSSGGPVYHQGALVGVVYAVDGRSGDGLAVPVTRLEQALADGFAVLAPASC